MNIEIDSTPIEYYSQRDEDSFFQWAAQLDSVASVDQGILSIDSKLVDDLEMRELLALLTRYGLSVDQLRVYAESVGMDWVGNKNAYWNKP